MGSMPIRVAIIMEVVMRTFEFDDEQIEILRYVLKREIDRMQEDGDDSSEEEYLLESFDEGRMDE